MGFDVRSIDFDDISRSQKQGVVSDVKDRPLEGVVKSQRARTSDVGDILNIGSGTRCKHCGFLHFMWRASCGACERPMEYNLGDRDEKNRM